MKTTMLENHSVEAHDTYLVLHLGDDDVIVPPAHKDTVTELCEYLDCLNLLINLANDQSHCIERQGEKITKLMAENDELQKRVDNQESLIKRLRAVAERNAKDSFKVTRELVELKQQLRDVGDWIEAVVNPDTKDVD